MYFYCLEIVIIILMLMRIYIYIYIYWFFDWWVIFFWGESISRWCSILLFCITFVQLWSKCLLVFSWLWNLLCIWKFLIVTFLYPVFRLELFIFIHKLYNVFLSCFKKEVLTSFSCFKSEVLTPFLCNCNLLKDGYILFYIFLLKLTTSIHDKNWHSTFKGKHFFRCFTFP